MKDVRLGVLLLCCVCHFLSAQDSPSASRLVINPAKIDFGTQARNSESAPTTITISNPSQTAVALQEILTSGIDFPSHNDCGQQLAAGEHCSVQIAFKPVISGSRTGILQITASDSASSHFVPLSGTGGSQ